MSNQEIRPIGHPSVINHNAFYRYKNKFNNQSIVIYGNGSSLNQYIPIENTINIGCNRCIYYDKLIFDFYFYNDWKNAGSSQYKQDIINYKPKMDKFFGTFPFDRGYGCSLSNAIIANAVLYDMEGPSGRKYGFQTDIDTYYVGDIGQSIVFVMMQFALYTQPRTIYIVGCDIDNINSKNVQEKYFYHTNTLPNHKWYANLKYRWQQMKDFINIYYSNIEIISINPIGLKGFFKDIYQND
jgi:hypothetical protein